MPCMVRSLSQERLGFLGGLMVNTVLFGIAEALSLSGFVLGPALLARVIKKSVQGERTTGEVLILAVLGFFTWLWLLCMAAWTG